MRKVLSMILAAMIAISSLAVGASAYDTIVDDIVISEDINSAQKHSLLNISSAKTATCISTFSDINYNIYSVKAEQTLEKHWALGMFFGVSGASWTKTVYSDNLSMANNKYSLESGTYRLKTVFTVTLNNGSTESITVYSGEVNVN